MGVFDQAARFAAKLDPDGFYRRALAGLGCVFADLAKRLPRWRRGLEGWNMLESTIVNEVRFGPKAAAEFDAALIGCDELERLTRWFEVALTAGDVAELRKAIAAG